MERKKDNQQEFCDQCHLGFYALDYTEMPHTVLKCVRCGHIKPYIEEMDED